MLRMVRSLRRNREGATFVEFAMISPVLLIAVLGAMDAAFNAYTSVVLRGAVADAARGATIEDADSGSLDGEVTTRVRDLLPSAQLSYARKSYDSFSVVGNPEDYDDVNGDGFCNDGESFEDVNGNGLWDSDRGIIGNGGARDVVEYKVTISYDRLFPAPALIGLDPRFSVTATTLLRNQPFADSDAAPETESCI
ncbi:pilus assembly protein [Erythrobacter sp. SDW2]|uniref:TadE/TadG family type IV pilus assembly protein n=1 Tax=Erythrobacter sp. SDW2 TaxID=2907154 RepID=UPI001F41503C|nr:TadE/TadG family type IV pilus assembly protein [Erythrobacter sp. SDW2]UIP05730.1 pilus assembly protein [Erythrobacter sp. SDW2]